jgi:hypothetical protein
MIAVLVTPLDAPSLLVQRLLPTTRATVGIERRYYLYHVYELAPPTRYTDPIDGSLLIELQTFDSEAVALRWIQDDDLSRRTRRQCASRG